MASNGVDGETSADRNVEIWKIKKLIKSLEAARGLVIVVTKKQLLFNTHLFKGEGISNAMQWLSDQMDILRFYFVSGWLLLFL